MATRAPVGVTLTPNPNVNAPAGLGGDLWGANGGGITPVGGRPNALQDLSNGQIPASYVDQSASKQPMIVDMSQAKLKGSAIDATADLTSITADVTTVQADAGI